jgi:UDP-N-acetylglucosamine transferase subunit ALG13
VNLKSEIATPSRLTLRQNRQSNGSQPKVLAISSTGGHWIQMLRLRPAFEGCEITFCTTNADYKSDVEGFRFRKIIDANRTQKFKLVLSLLSIARVVLTERPEVILSTGAAPGFFAIRIGKLLGKKTIWLDSIANAEELSLSGQKAGKHADLWLTQWEHLAKPDGPHYHGNVLGDEASNEGIADQETTNQEKASINEDRPLATERNDISTQQRKYRAGCHIHNISGQRSTSKDQPSDPISDKRSAINDPTVTKIFVTIGSDFPFDRMIKPIDRWAANNPETAVFAQIGSTDWEPKHIKYSQFLTPREFTEKLIEADLIIAHAGMGSILSALKHEKPILVMPRFGDLGETRNEHQVATVKRLAPMGLMEVAEDERTLADRLPTLDALTNTNRISPWASEGLTKEIGHFLRQA